MSFPNGRGSRVAGSKSRVAGFKKVAGFVKVAGFEKSRGFWKKSRVLKKLRVFSRMHLFLSKIHYEHVTHLDGNKNSSIALVVAFN